MQINTRKKDIIWNYLGIFFSLGSQVIFGCLFLFITYRLIY